MRHLATASDVPAVFMMQGVTHLALHRAAWIIAVYRLETIWAAMFFVHG